MTYHLFVADEDGGASHGAFSKEELYAELTSRERGGERLAFVDSWPDWEYAEQGTAIIIKGEIVKPRTVQVVKEFEIP